MRLFATLAPLVLGALAACGGSASIDRAGFDLKTCPDGNVSTLDVLTSNVPFDYLELRSLLARGSGSLPAWHRGTLCATATDKPACEKAASEATAAGWYDTPPGGAPPPEYIFVYTRADEVRAIGRAGLGAFLAPVETPVEAGYLAHVVTNGGTVSCDSPSARAVPGGYEVLTAQSGCDGGQTEQRVFVGTDGSATIRETVVVKQGSGQACP
jgi:hypothetical protein